MFTLFFWQEVPTVEMACAERKNKRRKLKGKKGTSLVSFHALNV